MLRFGGPLAAVIALIGALGTSVAQDASTPAATPGPAPWDAFCTGEGRREALDCEIRQRVVVSGTGQLLTGVTIKVPTDASTQSAIMVQTPYGLFLPAGLKFAVDGTEVLSLPLRTCDGNGCYASSSVSGDLLAALQRGETLTVTFQDVQQNDIAVPVSLLGFSAALGKAL